MNEDRKKLEKRMMDEEYGRSLAGCLKAVVVVVLTLIAIGVAITLLSL